MLRPRAPALAFVLIVLFLDMLGIGLVIPVLPRLIEAFVPAEVSASRTYGVFVSVYAAMQLVGAPVLGALSDRFGRRPVILVAVFGATVDYLLMAFAPTLPWLFLGRALAGLTGANYAAAMAFAADTTPPAERAQSFGLIGAACGLGFVLGPIAGGALGGLYLRAPFLAAAALNLLSLVYGLFVLPESLRVEDRRPISLRRLTPVGSLGRLTRSPALVRLAAMVFSFYLAQQVLQSVWALYTQRRFGWEPLDVGLSLGLVGILFAVVQGGLVRVLVPRIGERRALRAGLANAAVVYVAFGLANRGWMLYALAVPFALGALVEPTAQALMAREVGPSEQGELQGALASLASVAATIGPLIGTTLLATFADGGGAPVRIPGAAFFAASALSLVGLAFALRVGRVNHAAQSPEGRLDPTNATR